MPEILQICSYYIGSKLYRELYEELDRRGIVQDVFIPVNKDSLMGANATENTETLTLHYKKDFSTADRFFYFRKVDKIYEDLKQTIKPKSTMIAHAHSLFINGGVARRFKQDTGLPYIVEVQNTDINVFFQWMKHLKKQGLRILEDADAIVFYSPAYREKLLTDIVPKEMEPYLRDKCHVIGSGAHPFWFNHKGTAKEKPKQQTRLLFVGQVDRNKNVHTILKAMDELKSQGHDVSCTVIGKIADQKTGKKLEARNDVTYIPFTTKEELIHHYRKADIFVMPSKYETFGLVYVEAMTQGLPILYSKGQGFDGQAADGTVGYSVTYNDPKDIAQKVIQVLENYERLSSNAIEFSEEFSWTAIGDKYEALYKKLEVSS